MDTILQLLCNYVRSTVQHSQSSSTAGVHVYSTGLDHWTGLPAAMDGLILDCLPDHLIICAASIQLVDLIWCLICTLTVTGFSGVGDVWSFKCLMSQFTCLTAETSAGLGVGIAKVCLITMAVMRRRPAAVMEVDVKALLVIDAMNLDLKI